ncbi:MAG: PAS domain S-box protein [Spirochaetes bacterium]|nr:PAS domain S-box protein [Spirochaetota bacterium]
MKTAKGVPPSRSSRKKRSSRPDPGLPVDIFSVIFESNPIPIVVSTIDDGRIVKVNRALLEFTGFNEDEVLSRSSAELNLWDSPEERSQVVRLLLTTGHVRNHEICFRTKSGSVLNCIFSAEVITLDDVKYMLSMVVDVTDRVAAKKALAENEARYRLLVENMSDSIWVLDLNTMKIVYTSPAGFNILGYTSEESLGQGGIDLVAPDQRQMVAQEIADEIERDRLPGTDPERVRTIELKQVHKNGSIVWVEMNLRFLRDAAGRPDRILGVSRDITDRKRYDEELNKSREAYRNVFENSPIGIFRTCPPGRFEMVNPAMAVIFGYETTDDFLESVNYEASRVYYNIEDKDRFLSLMRTQGEINGVEFLCRNRKGEPFWVMASCRAILNEKNEMTAIDGFFLDITEQKRAEEERRAAQEQLGMALKEKELLLKEIHHRVKNNMQIISSLLGLQAMHVQDGRDSRLFEVSQQRVRSMALVHEKLYRSESLTGLDFQEYITDLVKELFRTIYISGRVNVQIKAENIFINLDDIIPCSLIIYELVSNALKHAFPGNRKGTVTIDVHLEGDEKVLRVSDDGVGLPEGLDYSKSDSLGLRLVNALAKQLTGTLQYRGNGGTEFTIRFRGEP